MFWMNNLPKNQVKTTDGPSQINYKLQAQKVCFRARTTTSQVWEEFDVGNSMPNGASLSSP